MNKRIDPLSIQTAVVTGAASGIGAAVVRQMIDSGHVRIIAIDRDKSRLEKLKSQVKPGATDRLISLTVDLTNQASVNRIFLPTLEKYSRIDVLIVSHGIADENLIDQNHLWDKVIAVNLTSTQRLLSAVGSRISESGRVVMVSSVLGRAGKPANTAYCASKHALLGLVKSLALDWAHRRITVNAVLPCWVDTPMLHQELQPQADMLGISTEQLLRRIKKRIPLGNLVADSDVADCISFLISSKASMITAQGIVVDGGFGCGV